MRYILQLVLTLLLQDLIKVTRMNFIKIFLCLSLVFVVGCNYAPSNEKQVSKKINDKIVIHKDSLILKGNEGNWYYKNKLFNGFAVKYYSNNKLKEKVGFYNGKKQGIYHYWFSNGSIKLESFYDQNVLVGSYTAFWDNGNKSLESYYLNGKKEGLETQWYPEGNISKKRNLVNGRENGLQQAWLKNGKIYVNYEAKNGRVFGMRRANLCYQLKNEKIAESKTN